MTLNTKQDFHSETCTLISRMLTSIPIKITGSIFFLFFCVMCFVCVLYNWIAQDAVWLRFVDFDFIFGIICYFTIVQKIFGESIFENCLLENIFRIQHWLRCLNCSDSHSVTYSLMMTSFVLAPEI